MILFGALVRCVLLLHVDPIGRQFLTVVTMTCIGLGLAVATNHLWVLCELVGCDTWPTVSVMYTA